MARTPLAALGLWGFASMACTGPAGAGSLDCAAIKNSMVPYEMRLRGEGGSMGRIRVYRGADLTRHIVNVSTDRIFQSDLQGNFQLASGGAKGMTIRWTYDGPTNRYIWQSGVRNVVVTPVVAGKTGEPYLETYTMLGEGSITLDGCAFSTKHYLSENKTPSIETTQDVWFSPELGTIVSSKTHTVFAIGKTRDTSFEVIAITTELAQTAQ